jgi:hypothetical protein
MLIKAWIKSTEGRLKVKKGKELALFTLKIVGFKRVCGRV